MGNDRIDVQYTPGESVFYLETPFRYKDDVKSIGGIWDTSKRKWKFAVDLNIWEDVKRKFGGEGKLFAKKSFVKEIERIKTQQEEFFRLRDLAVEDNPVDYEVNGISLSGKNPLFNYQKWGVKCCLQVGDGFLIGDQPGLGKSIQALSIAIQRKNEGLINNCLIVCLASLKYNWLAEIEKFTKEKVLVVDGTAAERRKKWVAEGYFFKIVNYEMIVQDLFVPNESKYKKKFKSKKTLETEEIKFRKYIRSQFDFIVVDEIHAIKSHDSQRTEALKQLKSKYRLGLSGTPIDGKLEELHSIFEFLKPGLFENKSRFLERHAIFDAFGSVRAYIKVQEVRDKILPYYLRRLKEKVLHDLPPKLFKDVYVELDKTEYAIYKDLVKGAHEITEEDQAATRILRARQFLDFPELLDMRNKSNKFLALRDLLEELIDENHEKVIIFTQYKQVLDLILFNLREKYQCLQIHGDVDTKDRVEIVNKFNADQAYPILIGTDAMSTGLNIGGANAVIHFEDNFSPAIMQQRNDRAHRATTRHTVTVYRFVTKNTIEERVRKVLGEKSELNNSVLDENCTEFGVSSLTNLDLLKYL